MLANIHYFRVRDYTEQVMMLLMCVSVAFLKYVLLPCGQAGDTTVQCVELYDVLSGS